MENGVASWSKCYRRWRVFSPSPTLASEWANAASQTLEDLSVADSTVEHVVETSDNASGEQAITISAPIQPLA